MQKINWVKAQKKLDKKSITYLWFGAEWCGDCHMMLPVIEEVENFFIGDKDVQFIKVDAEESNLFRQESIYKVKKVPTHVFIKNGKIKKILYEYIPKELIINEIEKLK